MSAIPELFGVCEEADLDAIVGAWSKFADGTVVAVQRLAGRSHRVYECSDDRGRSYIARLATPQKSRFDIESAVLGYCATRGIPVPGVCYVGPEPINDSNNAVMIMVQEKAPGRTLRQTIQSSNMADSTQLLERAGEVLAQIHEVQSVGFGPLSDQLQAPAATLGEWFIDGLKGKLENARGINPAGAGVFERAVEILEAHRTFLDACRPGLVHGDFSPDNVLVDDGRVTAVVDWEAAKSGPPALDIGWWDCFFESHQTPVAALLAGYKRHGEMDSDTLNTLRHLCVLRVMIGHFSWTLSVHDESGIALATKRMTQEVRTVAAWQAAG